MSETTRQHKAQSPVTVSCAVITVSDTRTWETDKGGELLQHLLLEASHRVVAREIIRDEPRTMRETL